MFGAPTVPGYLPPSGCRGPTQCCSSTGSANANGVLPQALPVRQASTAHHRSPTGSAGVNSAPPQPYRFGGRRRMAGNAGIGWARPRAHQHTGRRTRTNQCRSWRQCERRYGHRGCNARNIRCSSQTNTFMTIHPPYPCNWPGRPKDALSLVQNAQQIVRFLQKGAINRLAWQSPRDPFPNPNLMLDLRP